MPLALGSRLGPYEILGHLGAGGMGEVYRARDPRIGRDVAIKVLPRSLAGNADHLRRFEQEARATGTLNHPNLLTIFDLGTHEGGPFIVSELLDGSTLRDVLIGGRLPIRKVLDYAVQTANGLAAAHEKGVVHRDLKPENVFVTADDRVKLLDFGLAKLVTPDQPEGSHVDTQKHGTSPGMIVGTVGYMSPEQVRGAAIDHRSDIFSFAIVLYEMLTGIQPFRRDSSVETMNAILHDDPPVLTEESIPPVLTRLLEHAMEKNPSRRFESMKDVSFALDAISGSGESSAAKSRAKPRKSKIERAKPVVYSRVTFRRGFIMSARFAPDGTVIYGAAWEDKPLEVFSSHPATGESRPIGVPNADILSISRSGELALSLGRHYVAGYVTSGTLARMPIGGGAPRAICEDVREAVWTRDGKDLIVTRDVGGRHRIECPIGNVLFESGHWISQICPSPGGDRFGFIEHPLFGDDGGASVIIDRDGKEIARSSTSGSMSGLAWNPKGDEVWGSAEADTGRNILALSVTGRERVVLSLPGRHTLHDIAPDGRVLLAVEDGRREAVVGHPGDPKERNLTWFDWSWIGGLSEDGKMVLLVEQASAVHGKNTIFVRPVDGGPAVRIGEGMGRGKPISRDGQWIVAEETRSPSRLEILPIGPGQPRRIPMHTIENVLGWQLFSDNQRLAVLGQQAGEPLHLFELTVDGSKPPRQISPLIVTWPLVISNDEQTIAATGPNDRVILIPVNGGEPQPVASCGPGDVPIGWTTDNRALWVYHRARTTAPIDRADISGTGRTRWHTIQPTDSAGILDIMPIHITADGQTYGYGYRRVVSDLYVVSGLI